MEDTSFLDEKVSSGESTMETTLFELGTLVNALKDQRREIVEMEEMLKKVKEMERVLSQEEIPNLLLANGLEELKLESGERVRVEEKIRVSIPKDTYKRGVCLKWLIENEGEHIIKKILSVDEPEELLILYLKKERVPYKYDHSVHASTLKAFMRAALGMAKNTLPRIEVADVPDEMSVYIYKDTIIK